jgi:hypothetical protein
MVTPEQIEAWIKAGLPCDYIKVEGDGHRDPARQVAKQGIPTRLAVRRLGHGERLPRGHEKGALA